MANTAPDGSREIILTKRDIQRTFEEHSIALGEDPAFWEHMFDTMKAYADGAFRGRFATASAVATAVALGNDATNHSNASPFQKTAMNAASFVVSEVQVSMALTALGKMTSPGKAAAYVGFATLQKTGMVQGLLPNDQKTVKCTLAIIELSGKLGLFGLEVSSGIGLPVALLTIASLVASSVDVTNSCMAKPEG